MGCNFVRCMRVGTNCRGLLLDLTPSSTRAKRTRFLTRFPCFRPRTPHLAQKWPKQCYLTRSSPGHAPCHLFSFGLNTQPLDVPMCIEHRVQWLCRAIGHAPGVHRVHTRFGQGWHMHGTLKVNSRGCTEAHIVSCPGHAWEVWHR